MKPLSPDTNYDDWTEAELRELHTARVRQLLLLEYNKGPLILIRRQEAMVRQTRRVLHNRGIEL
jgi:hypothetical protein